MSYGRWKIQYKNDVMLVRSESSNDTSVNERFSKA